VSIYDLYNLRVNKGSQSSQPENQEQYPYQAAPAPVQPSHLTLQSNEDLALPYADQSDQSPLSSAEQIVSPEPQLESEYPAEVAAPDAELNQSGAELVTQPPMGQDDGETSPYPDAESSASLAYPAYPAPSEAQSQPPIESVGNTSPSLPSRATKPSQPTPYQQPTQYQ